MQIYGWQLLVLCHHPDKLCDHKHCEGGDKKFLICHVTSRQHMFKGSYEFMGGSTLSHDLAMFGGH